MSKVGEFIEKAISGHSIAIFSKSYCPYCVTAKNSASSLLKDSQKLFSIEMNKVTDGDVMHDYLKEQTGQRTVPYVFIKGNFVGGNSDFQEMIQEKNAALSNL